MSPLARTRPGALPGRFRALCCGVGLLVVVGSAAADELFSWWERGLLEPSLTPGAWVLVESREDDGARALVDTLRCDVLATEGGLRWLGVESTRSDEAWVVSVELDALLERRPLVESLRDLFRVDAAGAIVREELDELRDSQMFRRRLEDPFREPVIQREALPDTLIGGVSLSRERVVMTERREQRIPLGKSELHYSIELRSIAEMSPAIPVFGVLRSETSTTERTVHLRRDDQSPAEPPETQRLHRELRCIGFGNAEPRGLPAAIR